MLFVQLMKPRSDINWMEVAKRSVAYKIPEVGVEIVGEYVLAGTDPTYLAIFKADHIAQIQALGLPWMDLYDISVYPACTIEEMREMIKQMVPPS